MQIRRGKALYLILLPILLGGIGYLVWPLVRPVPPVVHPANEATLDPEVEALIRTKITRAEAHPRDAGSRGDLGMVYEANLVWEAARDSYAQAAWLAPHDPRWQLHQAIAVRQAGDFDTALGLYRAITQHFPNLAPAYDRLGHALLESGDLVGAESAFRTVIRLAPRFPQGYVGLGDVLVQRGEDKAAEGVLKQAIRLAPSFRMAHFLLGGLYRRAGRTDEALREQRRGMNAVIQYMPDPLTDRIAQYAVNLTARLGRAGALLAENAPRQAIGVLEKTLAAHPENVDVLNNLAIAYMRVGNQVAARHELDKALQIDAVRFSTYLNLSSWAIRESDSKMALVFADSAVSRAPEMSQTHFARGQILARLGRLNEALNEVGIALTLDDDNAASYALSGDINFRLQHFKRANSDFIQALDRSPDLLPAVVGLARTAWAMGDHEAARSALNHARQLAPNHPTVARLSRQFQLQ